MKTALLLWVISNCAFAAVPIIPRITSRELAKLQQMNPMTQLESPRKVAASVRRPVDQSIIQQSMILTDGSYWTLVPKGAAIHLPAALKGRVDAKPVGTLMAWNDFLRINQAWITTHDISIDQAAGNKPLQPERMAFWSKQNKVVIAVHQNGPISVRANKENQSPPTP